MTDERRDQIVRLLEHRDDGLPLPSRRDQTSRGFVDNTLARVTCPDCLANDRVMFGCETCGGQGFTEELRERDPYAVNHVAPYGIDGMPHERARAIDSAINTAARELQRFPGFRPGSTSDEIDEANEHPFFWEIERARMYERFDFAALDIALDALRLADPSACSLVHSVHVYGDPRRPRQLSVDAEVVLDRGLVFLAGQLPDPLRAPLASLQQSGQLIVGKLDRGAGAAARELRDARIRELAAAGLKPAEISVECHVSIRTVYNIVRQEAAA